MANIEMLLQSLSEIESSHLSYEDEEIDFSDPDWRDKMAAKGYRPWFADADKARLDVLLDELALYAAKADPEILSEIQKKLGDFDHVTRYIEGLSADWIRSEENDSEKRREKGIRVLTLMMLPDPPPDARDTVLKLRDFLSAWYKRERSFQEIMERVLPVACDSDTGIGSLKGYLMRFIGIEEPKPKKPARRKKPATVRKSRNPR